MIDLRIRWVLLGTLLLCSCGKPPPPPAPPVAAVATPRPTPGTPPPGRIIQFPKGQSLGRLLVRDWGTQNRWARIGTARGEVTIPPGKEIQLTMNSRAAAHVADLALLAPGDIHTLSINGPEVTDDDLDFVIALKGLHTLSLSCDNITDKGLEKLKSLPNLQLLLMPVARTSEKARLQLRDSIPGLRLSLMVPVATPSPTPPITQPVS